LRGRLGDVTVLGRGEVPADCHLEIEETLPA
jgi:hypothetical protein